MEIINRIGTILKIDCIGLIEELIRDSQREDNEIYFPYFQAKTNCMICQ